MSEFSFKAVMVSMGLITAIAGITTFYCHLRTDPIKEKYGQTAVSARCSTFGELHAEVYVKDYDDGLADAVIGEQTDLARTPEDLEVLLKTGEVRTGATVMTAEEINSADYLLGSVRK